MNNHKMILTILNLISNKSFEGSVKFNKALFLIQEQHPELLRYSWYRWDYGPFDKKIYDDLKSLEMQKLIKLEHNSNSIKYILTNEGESQILSLNPDIKLKLTKLINSIDLMTKDELLSMIYKKYKIFEYEMGDRIHLNYPS